MPFQFTKPSGPGPSDIDAPGGSPVAYSELYYVVAGSLKREPVDGRDVGAVPVHELLVVLLELVKSVMACSKRAPG